MLERFYLWYGKRTVVAVLIAAILLGFLGIKKLTNKEAVEILDSVQKTTVTLVPVSELADNNTVNIIGTVSSLNEAKILAEATGRVTSVNTVLGASVAAGSILATLENSAQRAAVLQAEGAYEAAVAGAAQSDVGVREAEIALTSAKNSAVNTYRSAYNAAVAALNDSIDKIFTDPKASTPGVRIGGTAYTQTLNSSRVNLQTIMPAWQSQANAINITDDLDTLLSSAKTNLTQMLSLVDTSILLVNSKNTTSNLSDTELAALSIEFSGVRTSLNAALTSIDSTKTSLSSAEDALERVRLGGTNSDVSGANAQVKIALGSLQAARASLAKTIIRTPIAGTVNELSVKSGDYVASFAPIAIVANNNALEITTFLNGNDAALVTVGEAVKINNNISGVITKISPAVNAETGKTEVIIGTESSELKNGDTVTVSLQKTAPTTVSSDDVVRIPLTAVKLTSNKSFVFTVTDNKLVAHEITLGVPNGNMVEVVDGIDQNWIIVSDARGLAADLEVEVIN